MCSDHSTNVFSFRWLGAFPVGTAVSYSGHSFWRKGLVHADLHEAESVGCPKAFLQISQPPEGKTSRKENDSHPSAWPV